MPGQNLRIAPTIADLTDRDPIVADDVLEASSIDDLTGVSTPSAGSWRDFHFFLREHLPGWVPRVILY